MDKDGLYIETVFSCIKRTFDRGCMFIPPDQRT